MCVRDWAVFIPYFLLFGDPCSMNFKWFVSALLKSYRHQTKSCGSYHLGADFGMAWGWIGMVFGGPQVDLSVVPGPPEKKMPTNTAQLLSSSFSLLLSIIIAVIILG